jgi:hypothetical protein
MNVGTVVTPPSLVTVVFEICEIFAWPSHR